MIIPLKEQEWLCLVLLRLFMMRNPTSGMMKRKNQLEESLASIAFGLHEMLASEWIGECHLAVSQPISPINSIVSTTALLRETIHLGRAFHVGANIHLPWLLHLERLLNTIPEAQRVKFVEQALKRTDVFLDPEILTTLETFFALDCNVVKQQRSFIFIGIRCLYRLGQV